MPTYTLPSQIEAQISFLCKDVPLKNIITARHELIQRYLIDSDQPLASLSYQHKLAYLLSRAPATFSALAKVLSDLFENEPIANSLSTWRDLGSGPGTAFWALASLVSSTVSIEAVECDAEWIALGTSLAQHLSSHLPPPSAVLSYTRKDLLNSSHSLSVVEGSITAYCLNEIYRNHGQEKVLEVAQQIWNSTKEILIIIEPGTPEAFKLIHLLRTHFLSQGAHLLAPCPHAMECPVAAQNDWCHFAARSARSSISRQIKEAQLPYEDEKYSYLVLSRTPSTAPSHDRILRHPQKRKGLVELSLCQSDGSASKLNLTQRNPNAYRSAREVSWGDRWLPPII